MGKRQFTRFLDVQSDGILPALALLAVSFLLGGLLGCGFSASVSGGGNDTLAAYIKNYMAAVQAGLTQLPELLPLVWEVVRSLYCCWALLHLEL